MTPAAIPKIFHRIWIGPKPFPRKFQQFIERSKAMHPDWEHRLWTDAEVDRLTLINADDFAAEANYGVKSDLLRLELIYQFGGVYLDTDCEPLRPMDGVLAEVPSSRQAFLGREFLARDHRQRLNNAVLGSIRLAPCVLDVIQKAKVSVNRLERKTLEQFDDVLNAAGPRFMDRAVAGDLRWLQFNHSYFYPREKGDPRAYVHHHYAGTWWRS